MQIIDRYRCKNTRPLLMPTIYWPPLEKSLMYITWYVCVAQYEPCDVIVTAWWRHQKETFSALLAICAGNSPVPGEFPAQRPVTRSFDDFFDLRPNKRLSKPWWSWWFETPSCPLWHHCNGRISKIGCLCTAIAMTQDDLGLVSV